MSKSILGSLMCLVLLFPGVLKSQHRKTDTRTGNGWRRQVLDETDRISQALLHMESPETVEQELTRFHARFAQFEQEAVSVRRHLQLRTLYNLRHQYGTLEEQAGSKQQRLDQYHVQLNHFRETLSAWQHTAGSDTSLQAHDLFPARQLNSTCLTRQRTYDRQRLRLSQLMKAARSGRNRINAQIDDVNAHLRVAESSPLFRTAPQEYPPLRDVFWLTYDQKSELLLDYAKQALGDLVVIRVAVLLLAILPFWYFKKRTETERTAPYTRRFRYVHRHAALMAPSIMLILAPLLLRYPPILLLDLLFITVILSVTGLLFREFPGMPRKSVMALIGFYIGLKFFNLLIEVTWPERVMYALSVLLLGPLFLLFRWVWYSGFLHRRWVAAALLYCGLLVLVGWSANLTGHFLLCKNMVLLALEGLCFMFILHVVIHAIGDYLLILGDAWGRHYTGFQPDFLELDRTIRPYLVFGAIGYAVVAVLWDLSLLNGSGNESFPGWTSLLAVGKKVLGLRDLFRLGIALTLGWIVTQWIRVLFRPAFVAETARYGGWRMFSWGAMLAVWLTALYMGLRFLW